MSGHSKWSTIRHRKGIQDARRSKIFSKLIREIITAARLGGKDENANPRLRTAIASAKSANVPLENIERAIKKGSGELESTSYDEMIYEGYGPQGVALLVRSLTDNKKRTASDIRYIFSKYNGNLGEAGCVSWMFCKKGIFVCKKSSVSEDELIEISLNQGAEDIKDAGDTWEIITSPEDFEKVQDALAQASIPVERAEITMLPKTTVQVQGKAAEQTLKLLEALEDHEDVQNVYSNFDIDDHLLEKLSDFK
jgi:YebC/PmpR family DNA-binding regulatory protein